MKYFFLPFVIFFMNIKSKHELENVVDNETSSFEWPKSNISVLFIVTSKPINHFTRRLSR